MMVSETVIHWLSSVRYLGVYLESSYSFRSSFDQNKCKFYRSFNCVYGKVGCNAREEVLMALLRSKCLLMLLYGTKACPINAAVKHSLEFAINWVLFKIFGAAAKENSNPPNHPNFCIFCHLLYLRSE